MSDFKTVEDATTKPVDPLRSLQREGVSRMRTSLLSCSMENSSSIKQAINQVTVLRIYHQVTRIIRYLDLMDKLEEKLYESAEFTILTADPTELETLTTLIKIQERLQESMINSHKLLQPYLELEDFSITELMPNTEAETTLIMSAESREKLRNNEQAALVALNAG